MSIELVGLLVAIAALVLTAFQVPPERWAGIFSVFTFKKKPEIAIGVVIKGREILLVHRVPKLSDWLHWQFPAGTIREGETPEQTIVSEVLHETGVQCSVEGEIGRRLHPLTRRVCVYFHCRYIEGSASNLDATENLYVRWVGSDEVAAYLGSGLYRKVAAFIGEREQKLLAVNGPQRA